jgi:hypothetical protein
MKRAIVHFAVLSFVFLLMLVSLAGATQKGRKQAKLNHHSALTNSQILQARKLAGLQDAASVATTQTIDHGILSKVSAASILVDSMANTLGFLGPKRTPIAYEPTSNCVLIVHRGYAPTQKGSGFIYYNLSLDGGVSFSAGLGDMNGTLPTLGRYPNITMVNPDGLADPNDPAFTGRPVLVYPILDTALPGQWGRVVASYDEVFGLGIPTANEVDRAEIDGNQFLIPFIQENNEAGNPNFAIFTDFDGTNAGEIGLLESSDNGVSFNLAATLIDTSQVVNFQVDECVISYGTDGIGYAAVFVQLKGSAGLGLAYQKTTDGGATWSEPAYIDNITGLDEFDTFTTLDMDLIVADNVPHIVWTLQNSTSGRLVAAELWSTDGGVNWPGQVISDLDSVQFDYVPVNGAEQQEYNLSKDADGDIYVKYIDAGVGGKPDIYISRRAQGSNTWDTPVNVTNSDAVEYYTKSAPWAGIEGSGNSRTGVVHTAFIVPAEGPGNDVVRTPIFYVAGRMPKPTSVADRPGPGPLRTYALEQNYPNPFNPSTSISFSLPASMSVKLYVYDTIGQTVATLVNNKLAAGSHTYTWNAQNVPSGLYFYRLEAENFSQTRKMVLMK